MWQLMLSTNINKAFKYSQNSQILTKFSIKSAKTLKLLKLECINDPKVFSRIFWEETEAEEEEERSVLIINIFVGECWAELIFVVSLAVLCFKNIARIANAVQVTICLLVSTSVY